MEPRAAVTGERISPRSSSIATRRAARSRRFATGTYGFQLKSIRSLSASPRSSGIGPRRMNIERHEIEQLFVAQLGEPQLGAPLEEVLHERLLRLDQLIDFILNGASTDELVHENVAGLTDAEGPIGGLILHRWIPPAIEVHYVRGSSEIEAGAASFERQDEERCQVVLLKLADPLLALRHGRPAV